LNGDEFMPFKNIIYEKHESFVLIKINRPETKNAVNEETWEELFITMDQFNSDDNLRVAIITGVGDEAFSAGADLNSLRKRTPAEALHASVMVNDFLLFMESMDKVVIAAINGWALGGGCEIALACDIRIASKKAHIGLPEIGIGIMPGNGGIVRLMYLVGAGRAKEMIYTGKYISAQEAKKIGLVNRVVAHENLMSEVKTIAKQIAKGPAAVKYAKKAMYHAMTSEYTQALKCNSELYSEIYKTNDCMEGIMAFLEKRKPVFKNS
jgi:enoyl-CoA hydratase